MNPGSLWQRVKSSYANNRALGKRVQELQAEAVVLQKEAAALERRTWEGRFSHWSFLIFVVLAAIFVATGAVVVWYAPPVAHGDLVDRFIHAMSVPGIFDKQPVPHMARRIAIIIFFIGAISFYIALLGGLLAGIWAALRWFVRLCVRLWKRLNSSAAPASGAEV
jgi:hypothetical protein